MVRRSFSNSPLFRNMDASGVRTLISVIYHLPNFVKLFWRLLKDYRIPLWRKVIFLAAVIYAISPIDILPEARLKLFGYVDDVVIFIAGVRWFVTSCPQHVVAEHVQLITAGDKAARS